MSDPLMDEIDSVREVLLRACTGMANGPDIMTQYDAQSAKLATQAEELKRKDAAIREAVFLAADRGAQLTKQSAVVDAAKALNAEPESQLRRDALRAALDALGKSDA